MRITFTPTLSRKRERGIAALRLAAVVHQSCHFPFNISLKVLPSRAGEGETRMPAASIAAILSSAPPLPPEMIAPAWPMRRPGGAVRPAMKPTIGFLVFEDLMN